MNGNTVWHTALQEMRSQRRLVRTHIFICIALVICTLYFLTVSHNHVHLASVIPMLGIISPRYIVSLLSGSFVALFCIGVLVLSFDQVKRDETNRIHEVLCSKPIRNLELFIGRLLGVMLTMAIPMICFLVGIIAFGSLAEAISLTYGQPIELWSVISFVLLDIVPNFAFFGSLVILFVMLCKSRLVAILLTTFSLGTLFWLNSRLPLNISAPMQTVTGNVLFASELTPTVLTTTIVLNRIALLMMSIGFLYWSSSLSKRLNPARFTELAFGCIFFSLGFLVIGLMFEAQSREHRLIDKWVKVHDDHFVTSAFPDVQKIRGQVNIDPGRSLSLELELDIKLGATHENEFVIFSLNPSYKISRLAVDGEQVVDEEFQYGLLKIPSRYFTVDTSVLELTAQGRPDNRFAYLDSRDAISEIVGPEIRQLRLLGTESSIFRSEFVALLPGIKWYPTSGTATNEDTWEQRERDFFEIDIEVSVPKRWLVAGPAKRETKQDNNRKTYHFEQSSPIPEFALVGSEFESASMEVEGIEFEVLYSAAHRSTFESFAPAEGIIRERVQRIIENVRDHGMNYPYGSCSLVEVPSTLRVFGGGMNMDTVMCPPGMLMIRETSLPTIPKTSQFDQDTSVQSDDTEQTRNESQVSEAFRYLITPMFESNLYYVAYQNLLVQQTNATQKGARALNIVLSQFSEVLFPFTVTGFDFQLAVNRNIVNLANVDPFHLLAPHFRLRVFSDDIELLRKKHSIVNSPEVWDAVASFSLLEAENHGNSALNLRALRLRSQRFVQLLRDSLGTDKLTPILVDLANRVRGKNFRFEEFVGVFADHGVNLEEIAGDLIGQAKLPGFVASNPVSKQVEDLVEPTFEASFLLHNDNPVSGPVQLSMAYQSEESFIGGPSSSVSLPPILVGANQSLRVVIESPKPVQHIWVKPYLSLNRMQLRVDLPLIEDVQTQDLTSKMKPFIKSIDVVQVEQSAISSITIDDLDQEFSVIENRNTSVLSNVFTQFTRGLLDTTEVQLDNGLPIYQLSFRRKPTPWTRKSDPTAFGLYRRTFVISTGNDGLTSVKFSATLPTLGEWKLEYYLPEQHLVEEIQLSEMGGVSLMISHNVRTIHLNIRNGTTNTSHSLNTSSLNKGWHVIGSFEVTHADVDVLVSNKTGRYDESVFADAIRWTPVETSE